MHRTATCLLWVVCVSFLGGCAASTGSDSATSQNDAGDWVEAASGDDAATGDDATGPADDGAPPDAGTSDASAGRDGGTSPGDAGQDSGPPPITCGALKPGQALQQNEHVDACNGEGFGSMSLVMQGDGNLVLYQNDVCQQATWATGTNGKGGYQAVMQTNGDLVVLNSSGTQIWHSNTAGNAGAYLAIQGDGNLVIYTTANKPIWDTGTWHQKPKNKLWIAQDGATANSGTETFFHIVLEMAFNYTRMETNWQYGRPLALGGYKVLGSPCSTVHSTSATVGQDSATLQCIENQTGWSIASGDVILYYPQGYGCSDGRNHWNIPVSHNGTGYTLEAAFGFTGAGGQCQQALGSHEVYEASGDSRDADCCNGQDGCAATPSPYGWYSFSKCNATWWAQTVAPSPSQEFTASACTKLQF